jgi:hypothetical protein
MVMKHRRRVRIILDEVEDVRPSALLYMAAVIMTSRAAGGSKAVDGTYPRSRKVELLLQDAGFFRLLGVRHRVESPIRRFPLDWIPHLCGNKSEGARVEELERKIFGNTTSLAPAASSSIYVGVTEAMTNVTQHAYPIDENINPPWLRHRWWLTGHVNRLRQELLVIICDLGIGIPKTLSQKFSMAQIREWLSFLPSIDPRDADLIRAATILGETRTGKPNRGKGLKQMKGVIDQVGGGSLHVLSSYGDFTYSFPGRESIANLPEPLIGTLIEWRLPLSGLLSHDLGEPR